MAKLNQDPMLRFPFHRSLFTGERVGRFGILKAILGIDDSTLNADWRKPPASFQVRAVQVCIANVAGRRNYFRRRNSVYVVFDLVIEDLTFKNTVIIIQPSLVRQLPFPCLLRLQIRVARVYLVVIAVEVCNEVSEIELADGSFN